MPAKLSRTIVRTSRKDDDSLSVEWRRVESAWTWSLGPSRAVITASFDTLTLACSLDSCARSNLQVFFMPYNSRQSGCQVWEPVGGIEQRGFVRPHGYLPLTCFARGSNHRRVMSLATTSACSGLECGRVFYSKSSGSSAYCRGTA